MLKCSTQNQQRDLRFCTDLTIKHQRSVLHELRKLADQLDRAGFVHLADHIDEYLTGEIRRIGQVVYPNGEADEFRRLREQAEKPQPTV